MSLIPPSFADFTTFYHGFCPDSTLKKTISENPYLISKENTVPLLRTPCLVLLAKLEPIVPHAICQDWFPGRTTGSESELNTDGSPDGCNAQVTKRKKLVPDHLCCDEWIPLNRTFQR